MTAEHLALLLGEGWALERGAAGPAPLARRLALRLRHLIDGGLLAAGTRLPAERAMADAFYVSRPTVAAALGELSRLELIRSRQGSGSWVAERPRPGPWTPGMAETVIDVEGINLAAAIPADASHMGRIEVRLSDLLSASPAHGIDPTGLPEVRARLAAHHTARGLPTSPDQVMVTNAAQHALALLVGTFAAAGDGVIVEEHSYGGLLDLLGVQRIAPVRVGRDFEGTRPDQLDRALRRCKLVYLTPTVHAPTGAVSGHERLRELAAVLDRHEATVIVDDTLADLRLAPGEPGPPLAALCDRARVLTVGSLSKSVRGGLRFGWIRADAELCREVVHHRTRSDLGTAIAAQHVALQVLDGLDELLALRLPELRRRADQLRAGLAEVFPGWEIAQPEGGLTLWARLPGQDAGPFVTAAARAGVAVMPGAVAKAARPAPDPHVRICFDREPRILDEALARLARS